MHISLLQVSQSFRVTDRVRTTGVSPETLQSILSKLAAIGADYIQLNRFANHQRGQTAGKVLRSFLRALQNYLQCYRTTVLSLEGRLCDSDTINNNNRYLSRGIPSVARTVILTSRSNWNFEVLVFVEGGKPWNSNPGKNPRSKARTNNNETASSGIEPGSQRWEAKAFPLRQPCSSCKMEEVECK